MSENGELNLWTSIHSLVLIVLYAVMFIPVMAHGGKQISLIAGGVGALSFTALFLIGGRSSISIPNIVSLLRLFIVISAALALGLDKHRGYTVFGILALAGLSDFFDGVAARRLGSTSFGAKLDMELDAFFIYMLALFSHLYYGLERWVLLAGLLRYVYVFILIILPDPRKFPTLVRVLSKGACALAEIAFIIVAAPLLGSHARTAFCIFAVTVLCASFMLDFCLRLILKA